MIFLDRSPLATAVVTLAMLRTWPVRFDAIEVHVVGEVLPGAGDAWHLRLAAELSFGADFAGDARHLRGEGESWSTITLMVFFSSRISPFTSTVIFFDEVAVRHGGRDLGDVAHLAVRLPAIELTLSVRSFQVPGDASHLGLAAELAFGAHFAGDAGHLPAKALSWSTIVLMVFFSSRISPSTSTVIFFGEVAVGDRGGHLGDVAHLRGEVAGHRVHVVGEVLPGAGDALDLGLAAELAFGAHLAGDAGHFRRRRR